MASTATVEVVPTSYSYVFSPYREPVARVKAGQRVVRMLPDKGCEGWHRCRVVGL